MKKVLLIIILMIFSCLNLFPQVKYSTENYSKIGLFGNFNYNNHLANFQKLPGIPNCCPKFESGTGNGFSLGLSYEYPLLKDLSLEARAGYFIYDGLLSANEPETFGINGGKLAGEFEHSLDSKISALGLEPFINYYVMGDLGLNLGLNFSYLIKSEYSQKEVIVKPDNGATFIDENGEDTGEFIRNQSSGSIPGASDLQYGLTGGIFYKLKLNETGTFKLIPELKYQYNLSGLVSGLDWSISAVRAGISMKYSFGYDIIRQEIPIAPEIEEKQILAYEPELEISGGSSDLIFGAREITESEIQAVEAGISAKINAVGLAEGRETSSASMQVEEFLSTNMIPILNYIFFEKNTDRIPERYEILNEREAGVFSPENLKNRDKLDVYHNLLNIIGFRMSQNPDANIILTGCNSGLSDENENPALSENRARTISAYLSQVWNINSSRIKIRSRNLPEFESNNATPEGRAENRRVEITSNHKSLLKPIITNDTLLKASPQSLRFYCDAIAFNGVKEWKIEIGHRDGILDKIKGGEILPDKIDWRVNRRHSSMPAGESPILYHLRITDNKNNNAKSNNKEYMVDFITIRKKQKNRLGDKKIDRYSLILFEFNSTELSEKNIEIANFIKQNIQPDSRVLITGYTDNIGDADYNRKLSRSRAEKLSDILGTDKAFVRGLGESEEIYDQSIPEGRFYSRTVEVEIETPIKW